MIVFTIFALAIESSEISFQFQNKRKTSRLFKDKMEMCFLTGKYINIRRTAVRGIGASRHHGGHIEGPLELIEHHSTMESRGIMGGP